MRYDILGYNGFSTKRDDDTFTFINNAAATETFGILASNWAFSVILGLKVPQVQPGEVGDYAELVADKQENPKLIKGIRLITDNINQLSQPFNWETRDSNGERAQFTDFPINLLPVDQFQSRLIDVGYSGGLVIGLNELLAYPILGFTSVTMTFVYDDFKIGDLLHMDQQRIHDRFTNRKLEKLS